MLSTFLFYTPVVDEVYMKKTAPMLIAEELSRRIAQGLLHPGERLIETMLAEEFSTSRAPVREALLMLERDRLVERVPHHGVVVRSFTKSEIHALYDVIYRLEEIAMEKAVANGSPNIDSLVDILYAQEQAAREQNVHSFYEANELFHSVFFEIAGNPVLDDIYQSLRRSARPFRILTLAQGNNLSLSYQEHKKQVEALRDGDVTLGKLGIQEQESRALRSLDLLFPE